MQFGIKQKYQPFIAAFTSCTLDPNLQFASYAESRHRYFITDIKLVCTHQNNLTYGCQEVAIDGTYSILISRNPCDLPIVDVGNFQQIPEGWDPVIMDQQILGLFQSVPCFKRGLLQESGKCLYQFQIFDEIQEQKPQQITQPSLEYKSEIIHNYLKVEFNNIKKYLNFIKSTQVDIKDIVFKPQTYGLYERIKGEVDIPNLAIMCFPEGVKITKKESGFKFFTFILTNDSAERYYCNTIIFSEKCSEEVSQKLQEKYGVKNSKGIFCQKAFTLISQNSCTEQTSKCLQYLYRDYLSKPAAHFEQKVKTIAKSFKINTETSYAQLEIQNFKLNFKINTSYPQTSSQSIYTVFKFLDVQNIVSVVQALLLERKIFFISDCQNIVGMAIEAFLSFIYPLSWVHGIINPLSSSMIEYKDAPMTVIFGLTNRLANKLASNTDCILVFLDHNKVQIRDNYASHRLFFHLRKQLISRLKEYTVYDFIDVRDYLNNPENLSLFKTQKTEDPHFDAYKIRNIFFELTVYILRNYNNYFVAKFKKNNNEKHQSTFKKYYDIKSLLHLNRKDPFMTAFFNTSLFSVLIQKKYEEPKNKWIKTLDRAIRKIESFSKLYIQEQSQNLSDTNEVEQQDNGYIPKGCLNIISAMSQRSDQQQNSRSTPSPKRPKVNLSKQFEDEKTQSPNKNQGRMSLPNQYERRHHSLLEGNKQLKKTSSKQEPRDLSERDQKEQRETTDKGSESCDKSESDTPELKQNHEVIVYQFDVESENQKQEKGVAMLICSIFSYPYRKMSNSVVTRWTKKKLNRLKSWKTKNQKTETVQVDMAADQLPQISPQKQMKKE